jgi:hypothetical protein
MQQTAYMYGYIGFQVITAAVTKSSIFWDTTPCSPSRSSDVSEEEMSIIRFKDEAKQERSMACSLTFKMA